MSNSVIRLEQNYKTRDDLPGSLAYCENWAFKGSQWKDLSLFVQCILLRDEAMIKWGQENLFFCGKLKWKEGIHIREERFCSLLLESCSVMKSTEGHL